jgi:hypothetical protein
MKQLCGGNSFRKYIERGKISSWKKLDAFAWRTMGNAM